ncbi:dihydrolipoamide acetyltransferase family protein [Streptomyces sp. NPDC086023]|uniref:dihydrolipoamide acetyltransferase family protein n=1 Tax=Streptomyces sp. NPDC086023 TaxID=3365746 RepID=UPI0037CE0B41
MSTAVNTAASTGPATTDFLLPDLGEGLTEAEVVRWLVAEGDAVAVDQPVVEVETAKATVEVPSPYAGRVATLHAAEGAVVEVGRPLISFAPDSGVPVAPGAAAGADAAGTGAAEPEGSGRVLIGYGTQPSGVGRRRPPRRSLAGAGVAAAGPDAGASAVAGVGPGPGADGPGAQAATAGPGADGPGAQVATAARAAAPRTATAGVVPSAAPAAPAAPVGLPASAAPAAPAASAAPGARAVLVVSPVVRALAARHGLDLAGVSGSGAGGVITRQDVDAALAERDLRRAAEQARAEAVATAAKPLGAAGAVVPGGVVGSAPGWAPAVAPGGVAGAAAPVAAARAGDQADAGPSGVHAAQGADRHGPARHGGDRGAQAGDGTGTGADGVDRVPLKGVRGAIARKLVQAAAVPTATVWVDVDATELLALRARQDADGPGLLALLARFTVAGLRRYPELNATVRDDEILRHRDVHLGVAAQTDAGLLVPVVRGADRKSARTLHAEVSALIGRARDGGLSPAELTGGTFTLNNFGVFGVDGSSMLLNAPEAGILGVGRIVERPWSVGGQVLSRKTTQLSLVFDHRVCDGGAAGGFLRFVADCIEDPVRSLADL